MANLDPQLSDEQAMMQFSRALFAIEKEQLNDPKTILNFEITHIRAITDLANQLYNLINIQ